MHKKLAATFIITTRSYEGLRNHGSNKYIKTLVVYIADVKSVEVENTEIWNNFIEGNFSLQKRDIPKVSIGCDHSGEQVNRGDKTRGGLKGITRNQNSRNQHCLAAPVFTQLKEKRMNKGLVSSSSHSKHHHLSALHVHRQGMQTLKLVDVLKSHELGF